MDTLARRLRRLPMRALHVLRTQGAREFASRSAATLRDLLFPLTYQRWISQFDRLTERTRAKLRADIARWDARPLISVLMPVGEVEPGQLRAAIRSLQTQLHSNWELCLTCDARTGDDVRREMREQAERESRLRLAFNDDIGSIAVNANRALALASGDYVALMAADAELSEQALYRVAKEIAAHPDVDLMFSDEDRIDANGERCDPWFKPDWNPALMLSHNGFGNLGVYRRSLVERVGGFRPGFDGAHDHDLVLRCARATRAERIRHIPHVLYHRRAVAPTAADVGEPSQAWDAGRRAIEEHLAESGVRATVGRAGGQSYQVAYALPSPALPSPQPRVSILLPSACAARLVEPCLQSLLALTTYENFEVLLLVNERHVPRAAGLSVTLTTSPCSAPQRLRVLGYPDRPFNYSWVNNWGASQASGDLLCFLNDDTTIITPDWLERLAARVALPGVAAAGPMLLYPDETIQHAGVILGLSGVAGHAGHGLPRGSRGYFDRACLEQDVSCLTAACLVMRRTVFQDLGGFDEELPIAFNDVDLCVRVRAAGWRMIWTPAAELYHHESASVGRHDAAGRADEFAKAVALMRRRWGPVLDSDPCYNPNLSLQREFQLAFPPRV